MATPMKNSGGTPASQSPILKCLEELNMFAVQIELITPSMTTTWVVFFNNLMIQDTVAFSDRWILAQVAVVIVQSYIYKYDCIRS